MAHQMLERDWLQPGVWDFKIKIGVNVSIKIKLTLLVQLHHRRPNKGLADRTDTEERLLRANESLLFHIGVPIALLKKRPAIFDDNYYGARDVILV